MTTRKMNENALIFKGVEIRAIGERLNLTDMWKAAGSDPSKLPAKWREQDATREFVGYIAETILLADSFMFRAKEGRKGQAQTLDF